MRFALAVVLIAVAPLIVIAAVAVLAWRERADILRSQERARREFAEERQRTQDHERDELNPRLFVMTSQLRILRSDLDRLAGEVRDLKKERVRATRLFHLLRGSAESPELTTEYFTDPSTDRADDRSGDRPAFDVDGEGVDVVDTRVVWLPSPDSEGLVGRLLIQRITWGEPSEPAGFGEKLRGDFYDDITEQMAGAAWTPVAECWLTPNLLDLADVAIGLDGVRSTWHNLVLGRPVSAIGTDLGLLAPAPHLLASVSRALPSPGDEHAPDAVLLAQVTGIVIGLATGTPLLADACVKSLTHDLVAQIISREVRSLAEPALRLSGHRVEPLSHPGGRLEAEPATRRMTRDLVQVRQAAEQVEPTEPAEPAAPEEPAEPEEKEEAAEPARAERAPTRLAPDSGPDLSRSGWNGL